jgi:small subunit ribosomal protein S8
MSLNDPLSNVLSQINSYEKIGKKELTTLNNSKTIKKVLAIMQECKYLGGFDEIKDSKGDSLKIYLLGNINKTGVIKPRFSVKKETYEKFEKRFLPAKDFGVLIVSTSKGMMVHTEAKKKALGGKLISYCY